MTYFIEKKLGDFKRHDEGMLSWRKEVNRSQWIFPFHSDVGLVEVLDTVEEIWEIDSYISEVRDRCEDVGVPFGESVFETDSYRAVAV